MIISGANLSHDYFTNRIDRYVLFENCADLISLYEKFFSILASYCSYITSTGMIHGYCSTVWSNWSIVSSKKTHQQFCKEVKSLLRTGGDIPITTEDADVMVYPTFQQEALNLTCDYDVFKHILELSNRFTDVDLFLTSGYVNFPPEVVELLTSFKGKMKFLFAAPQANSFFHDPGFASVIPALYNIVWFLIDIHI